MITPHAPHAAVTVTSSQFLMKPTQNFFQESLQQTIDAEIKSLEEYTHALKLRLNALQPVSSLPPEIVAAIFSYLCLPGIPSLGGKPSRNRARLRITHVCHRWREITLYQPQLWSHVDFNTVSLAGATEILNRAKSVPLCIETRASGRYRFGEILKRVQAYLPQIRHLSISAKLISFRKMYRGLEDAPMSPAPILEYLSLSRLEDASRNIADRQPSIPDIQVSDTIFGGCAPRLSCLKLRNCNISWNPNSPLLKGLKYLEIRTSYEMARPTLAVWLDTLDAIPQLKMLTLHSASPVAVHFPFNTERTISLPFLTHLDISASFRDCALASAHLVLPALSSLCLTATEPYINASDVQEFLPYIVQHIHGSQDIQPLRSVLIRNRGPDLDLLAWSVADIDTLVHDPPAFLGATLPTRVKLSWMSEDDDQVEVFGVMMAGLPLDGLLTLVAVDLELMLNYLCQFQDLTMQQFWLGLLPNWPLLRRVRMMDIALGGFLMALLEDCRSPPVPSLTELALGYTVIDPVWTYYLPDALVKRVEQGVPLETLDLRMCITMPYNSAERRWFSEISGVVDVLHPIDFLDPEDTERCHAAGLFKSGKMSTMWRPLSSYPSESDDAEDENNGD